MPLVPGVRLGPYEVVSPLGTGGMGEVYKARDTRLDRDVAIKVMSAATAGDPILGQRLLREARAASALNHPHICTIHDVGDAEGRPFIAMEWIDGESLADRLRAIGLGAWGSMRHCGSRRRWPTHSTPPTRAASSTAI
jgi:eukaryotic-like serine/threonine-protein kinase